MNRLEIAAENSELAHTVEPLVGVTGRTPVACTPTTVALALCCFNVAFAVGKAVFGHNEIADTLPLSVDATGLDQLSSGGILSHLAA